MSDTGTGYGRPQPTFMRELTLGVPATPMGELLRRYWHPIGHVGRRRVTRRSACACWARTCPVPRRRGRPGLVTPHCAIAGPRSTTAGWKPRHPLLLSRLAVRRGRPLPRAALRARRRRQRPRGASPGIRSRSATACLGLPGPARPQAGNRATTPWSGSTPGEILETDDSSVGGGGPTIIPCNWLQHYENLMDTLHVPILHGSFSGPQFTASMGLMPDVTWELHRPRREGELRPRLADGTGCTVISEAVLPTLRVIPNPRVAQLRARGNDRLGPPARRHELPDLHRGPRAEGRARSRACARGCTASSGRS